MKKQNQPCPFCESTNLEQSEQRDKLYRIAWMSKTNKKTGISKIHDNWINTKTRCNALNKAFPQNDYRVVSPAGANLSE